MRPEYPGNFKPYIILSGSRRCSGSRPTVEDIDLGALVFEAHHGRGDRDAALALDLHEVRRGAFLDLVAFDRPGDVDGTAEEQQLLGEGGFTRVGVGDDSEGAAECDFFL